MTDPRSRAATRTGAIAALVLASGLLTAQPATARTTAVAAPSRS